MSDRQVALRQRLQKQLVAAQKTRERLRILDKLPEVAIFLKRRPALKNYLEGAEDSVAVACMAVIAVGQGPIVFGEEDVTHHRSELDTLAKALKEVELFYSELGGIVGYHTTVCNLMGDQKVAAGIMQEGVRLLSPPREDLRKNLVKRRALVQKGLAVLPQQAAIYVVGGAAERLAWSDKPGGERKAAAKLPFLGRTLLEGLIRDLQAHEYLYYKLYGKQTTVPLALMTSSEKNNHSEITALCEENRWYGRDKNSWIFFSQPPVPLIQSDGQWCVERPLHLQWRPGGHGALWKLAVEKGILDELERRGCRSVVVRQINNPLGDTDGGLLTLSGKGSEEGKLFGFLACPRRAGASEGIDVLVELPTDGGVRYAITNIEYTHFKNASGALADIANDTGDTFPANTNLLFADIQAIKHATELAPYPGLLVNAKSAVGGVVGGRLESTMQNIADVIVSKVVPRGEEIEDSILPTFLIYQERQKTIATTKRKYDPKQTIEETPEGAYYALLTNYADLFRNYCHIELPEIGTAEEYIQGNWGFLSYIHPSLGPLFEIIGQKIRRGELSKGSELELEIAELSIIDLRLSGSLSVIADDILGERSREGVIRYGNRGGKCALHNVTINNKGIENRESCVPWRKSYERREGVTVRIHGNGEFYAKNVELNGSHTFEVEAGTCMRVTTKEGIVNVAVEPITTPSWWWDYSYSTEGAIVLSKMALT